MTAKQLALASVEGAIARDPLRIVEHGDPETFTDDVLAIGELTGRGQVRDFFAEMFAAFPDFEFTIERVVAEDDAVAVKWHAEATFAGTRFQGIEPTGNRVLIRGCDFFEIEDDWIRRNTIYYDGRRSPAKSACSPTRTPFADHAIVRLFNGKVRLTRRFLRRTEV